MMTDVFPTSPLQAALHHLTSDGHDPRLLGQVCRQHPEVLDATKDGKPLLLGAVIHEVGRSLTTGPRQKQLADCLRALIGADALSCPNAQGPDWLLLSLHPTFGDEGTSPRLLMQAGLPVTDEHLQVAGTKGCWSIIPDLLAAGANPANVPGLLGMALQESCHMGWTDASEAACALVRDGRATLEVHPPRMELANHWTPTVAKPSALLCWDLLLSATSPSAQEVDRRLWLFNQLWPRIDNLGTTTQQGSDTVFRQMVVSAFGISGPNWVQGAGRWDKILARFPHEDLCAWLEPVGSGRSVLIEAMQRCKKSAPTAEVWRSWVNKLQTLGVNVSERDKGLDQGIAELLVETYGAGLLDDVRWRQALKGLPLEWDVPDKTGDTATQRLADRYRSAHADQKLSYAHCLSEVRAFVLSTQLDPSTVQPSGPRVRM